MLTLPPETRDAIALNAVADELKTARRLHEPMSSCHEAYAVILEELDEFWEEVRKKRSERDKRLMAKELIQVAAMAIRAISDLSLMEDGGKT